MAMHSELLLMLTISHVLADFGRSFREAFFMFWATLWALVLGFGLSGAVQAFVSREAMQRQLGDHRPASIGRASFYGMVSSSCSYAASALAKSLFARGADFVAAMVFMFASTNLVVELGIVLLVLIGWQFVAAEFIGGAIMIGLLVVVGSLWFRGRALDEARHIAAGDASHHHSASADPEELQPMPWRQRVRSRAGWADAASYTMSDLTMLRKEILIGFVVAGFLAELVPVHLWNDIFLHGHGFVTSVENAIVGPLVAIISFVCSIGNVPLAAALWQGGISFGGVVSFVFADLITLPLLLIYRKQYGRRMTWRMLGVFWLVMSVAGFVTEYLFRAIGWVPTIRSTIIAGDGIQWNYTTILNIVALVAFAILYWLYRHQEHFGGGGGYASDPVCGMQIGKAHAPASVDHDGQPVFFCSEHCRDRFIKSPQRYLGSEPTGHSDDSPSYPVDTQALLPEYAATDPVCGMTVASTEGCPRRSIGAITFWFCSSGCAETFDADPSRFSSPAN